ncbi:hypothetical protein ACQEVB_40750 [Pseudonocardia sp. CA-107938]|uniref:hypothetical protein n=1 Tax=Pseudonocardia sp. CA-107938 TaxID=3240021 RepID=UPI003D933034
MSTEAQPAEGEIWAYRARGTDPFSAVAVVRYGTKKPLRVLVRFIAPEDEGREEWVPPGRLKVPWPERQAYLDREQRWHAVRSDAYLRDTPTGSAISLVCDNLPDSWLDRSLLQRGMNNDTGVLFISDLDAVVSELELDRSVIVDHPLSFEEGTQWIVPWSVGQHIVHRLAERFAEQILAAVDAEERRAEQENRWGYYSGGRYIPAEICAEVDAEYAPARALAREWCGQPARERHDELLALREEVVRLGLLVEEAVTALRAAGAKQAAAAVETKLGVPVSVIQAHAEQQRRQ